MKTPVHPGRILRGELEARGMSANALALAIRVPGNRISEIVAGRRGISAETALRIGRYFGTGPGIWMRLQYRHDLAVAERDHGAKVAAEVHPSAA